jgi:hypothetical protein
MMVSGVIVASWQAAMSGSVAGSCGLAGMVAPVVVVKVKPPGFAGPS